MGDVAAGGCVDLIVCSLCLCMCLCMCTVAAQGECGMSIRCLVVAAEGIKRIKRTERTEREG